MPFTFYNNEYTGQLLGGPNALWPTQPKLWVGNDPPGPPAAPHDTIPRSPRKVMLPLVGYILKWYKTRNSARSVIEKKDSMDTLVINHT